MSSIARLLVMLIVTQHSVVISRPVHHRALLSLILESLKIMARTDNSQLNSNLPQYQIQRPSTFIEFQRQGRANDPVKEILKKICLDCKSGMELCFARCFRDLYSK